MTFVRTLKQFYRGFKDEHAVLLTALQATQPEIDCSARTTMLLMRLMYHYFLHHAGWQEQSAFSELIAEPDLARVAAFFDTYEWRLDEQQGTYCLHADLLGYVFEQQINQKQMGAYYTQNDVTDYIAQRTILPYLLDTVKSVHPSLLAPISATWRLLRTQPERYMYAALCNDAYLPTETEREYTTRRAHYQHLYIALQQGQIHSVADVITYNLDIQRFVLDVITTCTHPIFLLTFYTALERMTVLDPTCGTGAFLLAALTLLRKLYTACVQRMQQYVAEQYEWSDDTGDTDRYAVFRTLLAHATPSGIGASLVNNLYGVDIMPEAVEVCTMQLVLALVGQGVERKHISTLRWNIHTGDALTPETWGNAFPEHRDGFDVIIGNPPYIEQSKMASSITVNEGNGTYGNLYAEVVERSLALCRTKESYVGLLVPLSLCSGERFDRLRGMLVTNTSALWLANFDIFPCRLFEGAYQRLTILLGKYSVQLTHMHETYVTSIQRWYTPERSTLIERILYTQARYRHREGVFPKLASQQQEDILQKLVATAGNDPLSLLVSPRETKYKIYYQEATNAWMKATRCIPYYKKNGVVTRPPHGRLLYFDDDRTAHVVCALLNSTLFYVWFVTYSDGFHLSHALVQHFPVHNALCLDEQLLLLAQQLEEDIQRYTAYSTRNTKTGDTIEIEEYRMVYSKSIIDEIDCVLAKYYGFSDEELDIIVHYASKYRMGKASLIISIL